MRKVVVTGIGMIKVDQHFDRGLKDMFKEASFKALEDAGNPGLEHVYIANAYADMISEQADLGPLLMDYCGTGCVPVTQVGGACGAGGCAIIDAFETVSSGQCDVVMVAGVEKMSDVPTREVTAVESICEDQEYEANFGLTLAGINAMAARSYMQQYSVTREQLSLFSVLMHKNAVKNPYACLPFEVTTDKVAESFPVADPLTFLDSSPVCDGAAAVIISSSETAPRNNAPKVEIASVAQSIDNVSIDQRESLLTMRSTVAAATRAYEAAQVSPPDINVCEINDSFTITGLIALEDLRLVERGKAGIAVEEGVIAKDGRIPTNPSGGLKARGHPGGATGIYQLAEVALQLRGEAGGMQVEDVKTGLTHNISGFGSRATVGILKQLTG